MVIVVWQLKSRSRGRHVELSSPGSDERGWICDLMSCVCSYAATRLCVFSWQTISRKFGKSTTDWNSILPPNFSEPRTLQVFSCFTFSPGIYLPSSAAWKNVNLWCEQSIDSAVPVIADIFWVLNQGLWDSTISIVQILKWVNSSAISVLAF